MRAEAAAAEGQHAGSFLTDGHNFYESFNKYLRGQDSLFKQTKCTLSPKLPKKASKKAKSLPSSLNPRHLDRSAVAKHLCQTQLRQTQHGHQLRPDAAYV